MFSRNGKHSKGTITFLRAVIVNLREIPEHAHRALPQAKAERVYWFNVSKGRFDKYVAANGNRFNIVVAGDEATEGDFYVIPYSSIKHLLTEETLHDKTGRERWIGLIRNHQLKISHACA